MRLRNIGRNARTRNALIDVFWISAERGAMWRTAWQEWVNFAREDGRMIRARALALPRFLQRQVEFDAPSLSWERC